MGLDGTLETEATTVHEPESAIEICTVQLPDVVLMDIVFEESDVRDRRHLEDRKEDAPLDEV